MAVGAGFPRGVPASATHRQQPQHQQVCYASGLRKNLGLYSQLEVVGCPGMAGSSLCNTPPMHAACKPCPALQPFP